jgi:hypothetical protein
VTGREKDYADLQQAFQSQIEAERVARELHETAQIGDEYFEQVLEDSDRADAALKQVWHKMKLGV